MSNTLFHPHCPPSGRTAAGAIVAVVAALSIVAFGGRADASCGDWLDGHPRMDSVAAAAPADGIGLPSGLPRPVVPAIPFCDGPACRGVPPLPVLPGDGAAVAFEVDRACLGTPPDGVSPAIARRTMPISDHTASSPVGPVPTPPPRRVALPA